MPRSMEINREKSQRVYSLLIFPKMSVVVVTTSMLMNDDDVRSKVRSPYQVRKEDVDRVDGLRQTLHPTRKLTVVCSVRRVQNSFARKVVATQIGT